MTDDLPTNTARRPLGVWLLASMTVLLAAALPFFQESWTLERVAVLVGAEVALGCLVVWLLDPARFAGAIRLLCFLIFLAYMKHMLDELGGDRSAVEAIIGFAVLGLPALFYAVFGRWFPAGPTPVLQGHDAAPREASASEQSASEQSASEQSASEHSASERSVPEQPASERSASEQSAS